MNHIVQEDGSRLDVFLAKQENITRSNVNTILEKRWCQSKWYYYF